jgi:hypothetical protein
MTTAETHSSGEYEALLRADFASFAQHSLHELNPCTPFAPGWHLEVIAAKLAAVRTGLIRRLIINKPYLVDIIQCIFHPSGMRAGYRRLSTHRGGMNNEGALSSEIWQSGLGVYSIPVAVSR